MDTELYADDAKFDGSYSVIDPYHSQQVALQ